MGFPAFIYYPSTSTPRTVLFGEPLSDLQESDVDLVDDAYDGQGGMARTYSSGWMRVRIVHEHFGSAGSDDLERELVALRAHLRANGRVGFAADIGLAWAARTVAPEVGSETLVLPHNAFTGWSTGVDLGIGDELVLEAPPPDGRREVHIITSATTTRTRTVYGISPGVLFDFGDAPVVARHRDFYPVMRLPKDALGRPMVSHDHRVNFTLDVMLEYAVAEVLALWGGPDIEIRTLPGYGAPGIGTALHPRGSTVEDLLGLSGVKPAAWRMR